MSYLKLCCRYSLEAHQKGPIHRVERKNPIGINSLYSHMLMTKPTGNKKVDLSNKQKLTDLVSRDKLQGPVVQSVVSLTSSLKVISLTVLADSIYNILIFFAEKM